MSAKKNEMPAIVVICGGGHAKVVINILKKLKEYEIIGYTDKSDKGDILNVPYLGNDDILEKLIREKKCKSAAIGLGSVTIS